MWEYNTEYISVHNLLNFLDQLNYMGEARWELIKTIEDKNSIDNDIKGYYFIFKRPLEIKI